MDTCGHVDTSRGGHGPRAQLTCATVPVRAHVDTDACDSLARSAAAVPQVQQQQQQQKQQKRQLRCAAKPAAVHATKRSRRSGRGAEAAAYVCRNGGCKMRYTRAYTMAVHATLRCAYRAGAAAGAQLQCTSTGASTAALCGVGDCMFPLAGACDTHDPAARHAEVHAMMAATLHVCGGCAERFATDTAAFDHTFRCPARSAPDLLRAKACPEIGDCQDIALL